MANMLDWIEIRARDAEEAARIHRTARPFGVRSTAQQEYGQISLLCAQ